MTKYNLKSVKDLVLSPSNDIEGPENCAANIEVLALQSVSPP